MVEVYGCQEGRLYRVQVVAYTFLLVEVFRRTVEMCLSFHLTLRLEILDRFVFKRDHLCQEDRVVQYQLLLARHQQVLVEMFSSVEGRRRLPPAGVFSFSVEQDQSRAVEIWLYNHLMLVLQE